MPDVVELSPQDQRRAERTLPVGHALNTDRRFTAQTVTTDLRRWQRDTSHTDLRGYDDRVSRQATNTEILEALRARASLYPSDEPDRYLNSGTVTRNLLEARRDEITDFDTFKRILREQYGSDESLRRLVPNLREDDYTALFGQRVVQEWLSRNNERTGIQIVMRQYRVDESRARTIWRTLPLENQLRFLSLTTLTRKVRAAPEPTPEIPSQPIVVSQRARSGTTYTRARPHLWTWHQRHFLLNRRGLPLDRIFSEYNYFFRNSPRTRRAIQTKLQRMPRLVRAPT